MNSAKPRQPEFQSARPWRRTLRTATAVPTALSRAIPGFFRQPVTLSAAFPAFLMLSAVIYTRSLWTNYIFDEQEALLANPYVNGGTLGFWDVFKRDFWGLPPTGTIGSYRPLPNMIWRLLWKLREHAWLPHWFNVVFHGLNGALVARLAYRWLRSVPGAWFSGLALVASAVITEAVCGVVGIADVLSGTFILLTLHVFSLGKRWLLPLTALSVTLGLFSKESTLTAVPLIGAAAFISAPLEHPNRPQRWLRTLLVTVGAVGAVVFYTYFRRHFFPVSLPAELQQSLPDTEPLVRRGLHEFLRWFQQPTLPRDPINNPLVNGDMPHRIAGALRVYFRGLIQVVFPWRLSGDYSFPQEPVPTHLFSAESVAGGALMILPPVFGTILALVLAFEEHFRGRVLAGQNLPAELAGRSRSRLWSVVALALIWVPVTYFPHSNIPVLLPTVRAERFWYIPVIGSSLLIGVVLGELWRRCGTRHPQWCYAIIGGFFWFQAIQGRLHALDYRSDLVFWRSTSRAVPNSAKAHLNYGVMLGARGRLEERLVENRRAVELAPQWPMAHIYVGDTLCRLERLDEAWTYYSKGFRLGPGAQGLISLALQCLWDRHAIEPHEEELRRFAKDHPGTWLAYLARDIVDNGEKHQGVEPKYRPRGYDQGPRE